MKHKKHVCQNCWYFEKGRCYNCDSPSVRDRFDIDLMRQDIMKIAEAYKYYYDKSEGKEVK